LPDEHGLEVVRQIHVTSPETVSVLLMTHGDVGRSMTGRSDLPHVRCLMKPVKQSDLINALVAGGEPAAASKSALHDKEFGVAGQTLRILLAEDNAINQKVAVSMLTARGHTVACVGDGREALERLAAEQFDLVLMDVQMPVMGGLEATSAIRERERTTGGHLPIIAMTAHAMKGDREDCLAAGMDDYVAKPIRARELFAAVEKAGERLTEGSTTNGPSEALDSPAAAQAVDSPVTSTLPDLHVTPDEEVTFDPQVALACVNGDAELLKEIVGLFLDDAPRLIAELREAIGCGDSQRVRRVAHTIKNSVGYFGIKSTFELALTLENMGRADDLSGADPAWQVLRAEIERLHPILSEYVHAQGMQRTHATES
jgi:CheY-like chemotaxis protein